MSTGFEKIVGARTRSRIICALAIFPKLCSIDAVAPTRVAGGCGIGASARAAHVRVFMHLACVATSRLWRVCSGVLARAHRAAGRVTRAARYEMRRGRTRGRETDAQLAVRCFLLSRG